MSGSPGLERLHADLREVHQRILEGRLSATDSKAISHIVSCVTRCLQIGNRDAAACVADALSALLMCLEALRDDETQEAALLEGLAALLDSAFNSVAADQGSSLRLPVGVGVPVSELLAPEQNNAGSGSPRSAAWSDVGQPVPTDNARLGAGRRWGQDSRRPAYDSARRARQAEDFLTRFPEARAISIW